MERDKKENDILSKARLQKMEETRIAAGYPTLQSFNLQSFNFKLFAILSF